MTDIITADTSKSGSLTGTKGKEGELQNEHFSNVLSLNNASLDVVKQPRIKEAVTRQEQIKQYDNKGIDRTREKKAFILPLNNEVFSFHRSVGKEGRQGESY